MAAVPINFWRKIDTHPTVGALVRIDGLAQPVSVGEGAVRVPSGATGTTLGCGESLSDAVADVGCSIHSLGCPEVLLHDAGKADEYLFTRSGLRLSDRAG